MTKKKPWDNYRNRKIKSWPCQIFSILLSRLGKQCNIYSHTSINIDQWEVSLRDETTGNMAPWQVTGETPNGMEKGRTVE
jgi:hypothetical protein